MTKKQISQKDAVKIAWDDIITEAQAVAKLGCSKEALRKMKREGKIKMFTHVTPSKTGNPNRPGKNPIYSMAELANLFAPSLKTA